MNRTSLTSRVAKLETASRSTGRVHCFEFRHLHGDRAKVEAQFEAQKAALIQSGEAGPDDLFVCFATYYEPPPAYRPAPTATCLNLTETSSCVR